MTANAFTPVTVALARLLMAIRDLLTFPPITPPEQKNRTSKTIEECATQLSADIAECKTVTRLYGVMDDISYFRTAWQGNIQAQAWYDSLMLALRKRGIEICNKK